MHPRKFALIGGTVMLALGIFALLMPGYRTVELPPLAVESSYGYFLGFLPWNIYNKLILIAFGASGLIAASRPTTSLPSSIQWSRVLFGIMFLTAVLGLAPSTNTLWGYMPLFGADIAVHAVMAALGAFFGFALPFKANKKLEEKKLNERTLNRVA